jgi:hypothetical protein
MRGVHFEEDTPKGSGVVGSDEEMYMNSQGEEDEEEVDETLKGKRKARTSLGISFPENPEENVEMRMSSQDEEAHTIETENKASSFFPSFKHLAQRSSKDPTT